MKPLSLFLFLFLLSCSPKTKAPFGRDPGIENRRWVLREIYGKPFAPAEGGRDLYIRFMESNNGMEAQAPCNKIQGMYTAQDDMIKIQKMIQTEMACPELATEQLMVKMLEETNRYELTKKRERGVDVEYLYLFNEKNVLARFEAVWL